MPTQSRPTTPAARAARLAPLLRKRPPDPSALAELQGLSDADLVALDAAAGSGADATLIRRATSFVRYWRGRTLAPKTMTMKPAAGTPVGKAAAVRDGTVSIATNPTGYLLNYTVTAGGGRTVADAQWLQFAARQVTAVRKAARGRPEARVPLEARLDRPFGESLFQYWLTTDEAKPNWNTDTSSASSPFFEEGTGSVTRTASTLEMFDAPSPDSASVGTSFRATTPAPDRVVSRFRAVAYLVKGMEVLYRVSVDLSWSFDDPAKVPAMVPKVKGAPATEIEPNHRARLLRQFGELDYLPGKPIARPTMAPRFALIGGTMDEGAWKKITDRKERYAEVARAAGAIRIPDVWVPSAAAINELSDVADGSPGKAGLNFAPGLGEQGTVRFVDADRKLQGRLPVTDRGALPRLAIILGPSALDRDAAFALATLRHEMEHARHFQLAIDWLLKWRADRPAKPFWSWLDDQGLPANVKALVDYTRTGARGATELLAHVEGLVAALPALPASPSLALVPAGNYPAAIASLKMLGEKGYVGSGKAVRDDAIRRIVEACCQTPALATSLGAWIDVLLDPDRLRTKGKDDKAESTIVTLIGNDFGVGKTSTDGQKQLKAFLEAIRSATAKPCRKR